MSHFTGIASWVVINILLGVFGPLLLGRAFVRYSSPKPRITLRQFYQKGELGLAGMLIGLSVILDIQKSHYDSPLRPVMLYGLYPLALASAFVWAVPLCNDLVKAGVDWKKVWRDSWRVALLVFSVSLVTEILLAMHS